ncbi:MAG: zinc ribbon domain-containing protein [Lachnospiraceae bacterium]|nr:zinc ribbon domain-containing protein [Lachnospiraceae bacterium]
MAFFDNLGKKLSQAGQEVSQQTRIFAETAKLNSSISDEEKQINNLYNQIGKSYFESNKDNEASEYRDAILAIRDALARIEGYKEQIRKVKGIKVCPNCGAEVTANAAFCTACGSKVPEPMPEPLPNSLVGNCPNCGAAVNIGSAFCDSCGYTLSQAPVQNNVQTAFTAPVNSIPVPVNVEPMSDVTVSAENNGSVDLSK